MTDTERLKAAMLELTPEKLDVLQQCVGLKPQNVAACDIADFFSTVRDSKYCLSKAVTELKHLTDLCQDLGEYNLAWVRDASQNRSRG